MKTNPLRLITLSSLVISTVLQMGCQPDDIHISLPALSISPLIEIPDLVGEVIVEKEKESGGREEIARSVLKVNDNNANATLPGLESDVDLYITIIWYSGLTTIAHTTSEKTVRVGGGETKSVLFTSKEYSFPDDDEDGATNLAEILFENENPDVGTGTSQDSELLPKGFFTGISEAIAAGGYAFWADILPRSDHVVSATYTIGINAQGGAVYNDHQFNVLELANRYRQSIPLECPGSGQIWDVKVNSAIQEPQIAILCGHHRYLISASMTTGLYEIASTNDSPSDGGYLLFSKDGTRLYHYYKSPSYIFVIDADYSSATFGQIIETIDPDVFPSTIEIWGVADTGTELIILDHVNTTAQIISYEDDNYFYNGTALEGLLLKPTAIALDPIRARAYITDSETQWLNIVDISDPLPLRWRTISRIPMGPLVSSLAIEPTLGFSLYAAGGKDLLRISTLSEEITHKLEMGQFGRGGLLDISVGPEGDTLVATSPDNSAILLLGRPDERNIEKEPNQVPEILIPQQNTLGPAPGRSVGYIDSEETGTVEFDHWVIGGSGPVPYSEDIEDLWLLDTTGLSGRLAIALLPTDGYQRLNLSLIDQNSHILQTSTLPMGAAKLSTGTGVFLITPPASELPSPLWVGVGARDFDMGVNYGFYELVVLDVDSTLRTVPETSESNNSPEEAQAVTNLPIIIEGHIATSDGGLFEAYAGEDVEDCYRVQTSNGRPAVMLNYTADVNLDIFVFNPDGSRVIGQYGLIGNGEPEFFIFEPYLFDDEINWKSICVNIDDDSIPTEVDYELTFIDFAL